MVSHQADAERRPVVIAVDPGYDAGVAELWSDGFLRVTQIVSRNTRRVERKRARLGALVGREFTSVVWPRMVMEFGQFARHRPKASLGLGMTVGVFHAIPVEDGGLDPYVNPSTWMVRGWDLSVRALEQAAGAECPGPDARAAVGLLHWWLRHLPVRDPIRRIGVSRLEPRLLRT